MKNNPSDNVSKRLSLLISGAQTRNRTKDTGIFSPLLYLLSYLGLKNGAEDEIRTRDPRLGKAMLYH